MSRPSAVVISPEAPYPMHGGGAIRTASLLQYLSSRYHLDLILFRQAGDSDPARSLPPGLVRQSRTVTLPFHSRKLLPWILRNGSRWLRGAPPLLDRFSGQAREVSAALGGRHYDLGLIEHFWCAPYIEQLAPSCNQAILDLHNIESALHGSCARSASGFLSLAHTRFERTSRHQERRWLPRFSRLLCTSSEDADRLLHLAPKTPVTIYRNALPATPVPAVAEEMALGFSANFEYHPNIAAVRFLVTEIWPVLAARFPDLKLRLIGKNPHAIANDIKGHARIETTGPIDDAVTELARVKVAIVPLLSGSGTRLKILEAWAAARPVVSTAIGAEGLQACPEIDIVLADTPGSFIASVSELLGSTGRQRRIGTAGRHTFEERFTWEAVWPDLPM